MNFQSANIVLNWKFSVVGVYNYSQFPVADIIIFYLSSFDVFHVGNLIILIFLIYLVSSVINFSFPSFLVTYLVTLIQLNHHILYFLIFPYYFDDWPSFIYVASYLFFFWIFVNLLNLVHISCVYFLDSTYILFVRFFVIFSN